MDQKLKECLSDQIGSYILPFFWQHGEPQQRLLTELEAIAQSGIREFCVESRPYEAFGQEQWYEDFGFLLREAKKRNMRVWLLDDKAFPSGYANGYLQDPALAHLRKGLLRETHVDVMGPMEGASLLADRMSEKDNESLLAVIAYRRSGEGEVLCGEPVFLTGGIKDGLVFFDIPEGMWRVFFLIRTSRMSGAAEYPERFSYYIDMLSKESCESMIKAVYQPHYDRFSQYFGNTFAGFFSDEPCFCNEMRSYYNKLGTPQNLPWRDTLLPLLEKESGLSRQEALGALPALWFDAGAVTARIRTAYMEAVSKLYRDNFCYQLGDWCRAHNVLYIGHVIEDMNAHMRLGYGSGHYFRALEGQDMGGIDVVLHQILPGNTETVNTAPVSGGVVDPEFFCYALAKLGASAAHLEPLKKGRAMCEIYGAFGWAEGLPFMKKLTDHMLANGINYYVPHAFTPKYPDPDCPPHFYAEGKNPQFPLFGQLMQYLQRMCHLLSEGTHVASAAVFYNAQAEWAGGKYQLFQKAAKHLTQHQLDFDFVSSDMLEKERCEVIDGRLWINGVSFGALVVPQSQFLPMALLERMGKLAEEGLPVLFTDSLPERSCEGEDISRLLPLFETLPLSHLSQELESRNLRDITLSSPHPHLRVLHYTRVGGGHLYLFSNENTAEKADCQVKFRHGGKACMYDAWENRAYALGDGSDILSFTLAPGGATAILFSDTLEGVEPLPQWPKELFPLKVSGWKVECRETEEKPWEDVTGSIPDLGNISRVFPRFTGTIRYTAAFQSPAQDGYRLLDLGNVGETAQVWLNGKYLGARICQPYAFPLEGVKEGENQLEIQVVNSPAYRERDPFSAFLPLPPSGLMGPVRIG